MSQRKRQNSSKSNPKSFNSNKQRINKKPYKKPNKHNSLKDIPPIPFTVDNLLHDGRGVGIYGNDNNEDITLTHPTNKHGKKVFVSFALPNETVEVKITNSRKSFEEGDCIRVLNNPHPERQQPICQHFGTCGGCSLQHWQEDGQIAFKESVLSEMLTHQADIQPDYWIKPVIANRTQYRTKARIGIRYLSNKNQVILGFRERSSNHLTAIKQCPILDPRVGSQLDNIRKLIESLDQVSVISHLEVAVGEEIEKLADSKQTVAIIIRHLQPLSDNDIRKLKQFFNQRNWQLYLQAHKNPKSIQRIQIKTEDNLTKQFGRLYYKLPYFDLTYEFIPTDFTQVNMSVNQKMVKLACELLGLKAGDRVLDLFSGLGNFSLAIARLLDNTGLVVGIEGSNTMTKRAKDNARRNKLTNTQFYTHDLTQDLSQTKWANSDSLKSNGFDAILIDPPRSGAWEVMQYIPKFDADRIVYVSCNPATLARDSKALIEAGYKMTHAGVMDMFCHTGHVESIARFEKVSLQHNQSSLSY